MEENTISVPFPDKEEEIEVKVHERTHLSSQMRALRLDTQKS